MAASKRNTRDEKKRNLSPHNDQLGENASEELKSENYENAGKKSGSRK